MEDEHYMAMAIKLASKGHTSPNPMVGAVIVKDGKIIGEGFHEGPGLPHAEINALEGVDAKDSTLFVSLEPCSHFGRTPPCTDAIISAGVSRVVCAMEDPNPLVSGIEVLRETGIEVDVGVLEDAARKLNESFIKYMETGMPFVTLKSAMSLDGKISTNSGDSKWITSSYSRKYSRDLRARNDAILVGVNTVLKDDPRLRSDIGKDPLRIILDSKLSSPLDSKVYEDGNVLVATTSACSEKKIGLFRDRGIEVVVCGDDSVDVIKLAAMLGKRGITSIIVEGGSDVNASFVRSGIVDKLLFFIAPKLIGGRTSPGPIGGEGIESMEQIIKLRGMRLEPLDGDMLIEAYPDQSR